jgi:SAM-dependent methyltransferase
MTATEPVAGKSPIVPTRDSLLAKYARLDRFLEKLRSDVYPEPETNLHDSLTAMAWKWLVANHPPQPGAKVLDVGCGQGVALKHFVEYGLDSIGIALGDDVGVCRQKGFNVVEMDLSFLEFPDATFDIVWCRHVLEHSIFPLFSLAETFRVLKPGGILYCEVPAPDTFARHQANRNHYSVFGLSMWSSLIGRAGYGSMKYREIPLELQGGKDLYFSFYAFK